MTRTLPCILGLFSLIFVLGCDKAQEPETPETVKLGFLGSGDRATYANAAAIAVAEVNDHGGLLGMPVELVPRVEIEDAAVSVQTAETIIGTEGVIAIIGPNRSTHAVEVGKIAQQHGLPMVTTAATNPDVTKAGDFVFMAAFTDQFQGRVMARFAREELELARVATLTRRDDVYTEGISEFFVSHFSGAGGTVVANVFFESGQTDFTGPLIQIAATSPEALFISGFARDVALVTEQARALPLENNAGERVLFLGADSWDNPSLFASTNAEVEGSYFSSHFSPDTDEPGARAFVDTYQSLYEVAPSGGDAVSYDAVKLLFEAVERAESLDPDAVRKQLAATSNYAGATRIAGYDENRHPTKSAVVMTIKNGAKQFHKQIDPAL